MIKIEEYNFAITCKAVNNVFFKILLTTIGFSILIFIVIENLKKQLI